LVERKQSASQLLSFARSNDIERKQKTSEWYDN